MCLAGNKYVCVYVHKYTHAHTLFQMMMNDTEKVKHPQCWGGLVDYRII